MASLGKPRDSAARGCPFTGSRCAYPCHYLNDVRSVMAISNQETAALLDVAPSTWWRYRRGQQRPPRAVCGYLHVLMGHLPWPGWDRSFVNRKEQRLYIDDYQFGLDLQDLRAYWWQVHELRAARREIQDLRAAVRDAQGTRRAAAGPLGLVYTGTKLTR